MSIAMTYYAQRLRSVLFRVLARAGGAPFHPLAYAWCASVMALAFGASSASAAPSVPTGLAASAIAGTSFTLTWSASTGSPTGYDVFKNATLVGSTSGTPLPTTFNVPSLTPNTTYSMTVKSKNASGSSAASAPLSVTTGPVAPTNLSATNKTMTTFTLNWIGSTGAASYEVFRDGVSIGVTSGSSPAFNVTGLFPNAAYTMTVKGRNSLNTLSDASAALVVTTAPVPPANLSATNKTATSFTLNWVTSTGAVSYEVFQNGISIGSTPTGNPPAPAFNVTGLMGNRAYTMTVKATNAENTVSGLSTPLTVITSPPANQPPTVALTAPAEGRVYTVPTRIALAATASDPDGTVSKVEFFDGANKLGQAISSPGPFTFSWNATVPGTKSLTARATDNLGATKDSTAISVRLLPSLPFTADFETSEGYALGSLNGQRGWSVSGGSAQIVNTQAAHGTQSVVLGTGATATEVEEEFGSVTTNPSIVYVDFFTKPVAGIDYASSTLFEVDAARVAFVKSGSTGQFAALDGDGAGNGSWKNLGPALDLDGANTTTAWARLSVRLNYTTKTYDLYINGQLVSVELKFRLNTATFFSWFSLKGNPSASVALDDIFVANTNPLFTDTDNDGIDDAWETAHGLNPALDDRNSDLDGDGLSNIEEYLLKTLPENRDSDGDGVNDGVEIRSKTDPLTRNSTGTVLPVSGIRLHLCAEVGVVTDQASAVVYWNDLSDYANDAEPALFNGAFEVIANQVNGRPVVHCSGSGDWLRLPHNMMASLQEGEIFAVVQMDPAADQLNSLWNFGTAYGGGHYNGDRMEDFGSSEINFHFCPVSLSNYLLINVSASSGGTMVDRVNGVQIWSRPGNTLTFNADPSIGAGSGDIAEIVLVDHVLTPSERDAMGRYFQSKYILSGISVPPPPSLQAFTVGSSQIDLKWSGQTAYSGQVAVIERKTQGGDFSPVRETEDQIGYTDNGLFPDTTYTYRIKLRTYAGASAYSSAISVKTLKSGSDYPATGIRLWLRSSAGINGEAAVDGWQSQAPELSTGAYQEDTSLQPRYSPDQINGLPAVRFDGVHQLNLPEVLGGAVAGEIIAVVRADETGEQYNSLWRFGTSGYGSGFWNGSRYEDFGTNEPNWHPGASARTRYHITDVGISADGTMIERANGVVVWTRSGANVGFGASPVLGPSFFGEIAEVAVYDHVLSESERKSLYLNLGARYGQAVGDYASPTAPTEIAASNVTTDAMTISWTASQDNVGVAIYEIYLNGVLVGTTSELTYSLTGLTVNTAYNITVIAKDAAGNASEMSAVKSVMTDNDKIIIITIVSGEWQEGPLASFYRNQSYYVRPTKMAICYPTRN